MSVCSEANSVNRILLPSREFELHPEKQIKYGAVPLNNKRLVYDFAYLPGLLVY